MMTSITDIGVFFVCIGITRLLWSCSRYIDKAKPAKDISCGLQAEAPSWGFNLGISGHDRQNAKDHPASASSGRSGR